MSEYDEVCRFYTNWMHSMCTKRAVAHTAFFHGFRIKCNVQRNFNVVVGAKSLSLSGIFR